MAAKNRAWVVKQEPVGVPQLGRDIELVDRDLPKLTGDGQFIAKLSWISLDPFLRGAMNSVSYSGKQTYPFTLTCFAVATVTESTHLDYAVGTVITGTLGCQEYFFFDTGSKARISKVPAGIKESHALGVLGMPGATAYFGLLEIGKPKEGETIVVSSAAGAVGALVAQIGKIKGCRVVGFAGGKGKCDFVKSLGADECIDYKGKTTAQLVEALKAAAPKGVDVYFDNVGGPCTEAVFQCVNTSARIAICGQIAYYNMTPEELAKVQSTPMTYIALHRSLTVRGFLVFNFPDWTKAFGELIGWLKDGKIQVKEDVADGFENLFTNLLKLFGADGSASNFGKLVLKV
jgi:NADPH-dependent curcumin reductase CurA